MERAHEDIIPSLNSSLSPKVKNGGFGKQQRFFEAVTTSQQTPGPNYTLPSFLGDHAMSPLYKGGVDGAEEKKEGTDGAQSPSKSLGIPHPGKDRTAWMIGVTKNDLAYYSDIAGDMGPAHYTPNPSFVKHTSPRTMFEKNERFQGIASRYMGKEFAESSFCLNSPGPKYKPDRTHLDLKTQSAPRYSFGGKGIQHRASFLNASIKNGYMYAARPATCDKQSNVSPANYEPKNSLTSMTSPRPVWGKADRFKDYNHRFISEKHNKTMATASPGPMYYPTNNNVGSPRKKAGTVPAGKWCP